MRKLFSLVLILSLTGVFLSGYLLWIHFASSGTVFPSWLPCGDPASACQSFSHSDYSDIAGVPIASFGLFYYLWLAGLAAVLVFSGYISSEIVLGFLAVSVAGMLADMALGAVLVYTRNFCSLCVTSYGVSFLILLCAGAAFRREIRRDREMLIKSTDAIRELLHHRPRLFRLGLIGAYTGFCALSVAAGTFAFSQYLESKERGQALVENYVENFSRVQKSESVFPESMLSSGNSKADVVIAVFSDPFCASCKSLYYAEEPLLEEFSGSIRFSHYLLPLDKECNPSVKGEGHRYSCSAAANIVASAKLGFYDEFIRAHWKISGRGKDIYKSAGSAGGVLDKLLPGRNMSSLFGLNAGSPETRAYIDRDIKFAHSLGVKGTPSVFVNGRRLPSPVTEENLRGVIIAELRTR
jgi:protein-disulfide isomerase/uncharacterized membrane protein